MLARTRQTRIDNATRLQKAISQIESLEGRLFFSTYTVTGLRDAAAVVTPNGAGKFNASTLRAAITAANGHAGADSIKFASAIAGTIDLGLALPAVADTLTLTGPGAAKLTVQRSNLSATDFSIFRINTGVTATISAMTIAKGTGTMHTLVNDWGNVDQRDGGGIFNEGRLILNDCNISEDTADLYPIFGYSVGTGGGIFNRGQLKLNNTLVYGNSSPGGGGITNSGTLICLNSEIESNSSSGGDDDSGSSFGYGGGILNNSGGQLELRQTHFSGNYAVDSGGAILNYGGLTADGCTFSSNETFGQYGDAGAGIDNYGTATVRGSVFAGNASENGYGAAIHSAGTLNVSQSSSLGNSAQIGGAIAIVGGTASIRDSLLANNKAFWMGGGGIDINAESASVALYNCTLTGNGAEWGGGGISLEEGSLSAINCTVTGNSSNGSGLDGYAAPGGIANYAGTVLLNNTIVAMNQGADGDLTGDVAKASAFNVIGLTASSGLARGRSGNRVGVTSKQLKLGSLASSGGPTMTIALLPGSIAINAGSNAKAIGPDGKPLTTDQRGTGYARIVGGRVDVGAFERQSATDATGSVSGVVFVDLNGNRKQDPGESGVKGLLVWADLNRDGKLNFDEPRAVTNAGGQYLLTAVPTGQQLIRLEPQPGWKQTQPLGGGPNGPTLIAGLETKNWSFGVIPILGG